MKVTLAKRQIAWAVVVAIRRGKQQRVVRDDAGTSPRIQRTESWGPEGA
jgi:hypothetical protein